MRRAPAIAIGRLQGLAALLLGALTVLGFAPFGQYWVPLVTLTALALLWRNARSPRAAAWVGFAFGIGLFSAGVHWLYISLHDIGGMPAPAAVVAVLLLSAWLALFPALTGFATRASRAAQPWVAVALLPALWTLTEWLRGWVLTGFPWLSLGFSQTPDGPFAAFAPIAGVYGVSFAIALFAALAAQGVAERSARWLLAAVLFAACTLLLRGTEWTARTGEPLTVSLLQGNIPQDLKFRPEERDRTLRTYRELVLASRSRLIVTPESAMPLVLDDVPPEYLAELEAHARGQHADLLLGAFVQDDDGRYYNSMVSLGSSQRQRYRKHHLVPFGEYIPLRPLIGLLVEHLVDIPMSDQQPASDRPQPFLVADQVVDVDICYEDVFGDELRRRLPQATVLVNVSNDAWFGRLVGPEQHLQIGQTRALETGRTMLRATNTGVTAIVDRHGRVQSRAPVETTAALQGSAQGYAGATPYVVVGDDGIVALCGVLLVGTAVASRTFRVRPVSNAGRQPPIA